MHNYNYTVIFFQIEVNFVEECCLNVLLKYEETKSYSYHIHHMLHILKYEVHDEYDMNMISLHILKLHSSSILLQSSLQFERKSPYNYVFIHIILDLFARLSI